MPVVKPGATVLVSGANGYIAFWIVRYLLEHGFVVRGTVRSETKGVYLKEAWKAYGDKFECVVVEDITKVRPEFWILPVCVLVLVGGADMICDIFCFRCVCSLVLLIVLSKALMRSFIRLHRSISTQTILQS